MATEIAKVYVNDISIANLEIPVLGKTSAISAYLAQKQFGIIPNLLNKKKRK